MSDEYWTSDEDETFLSLKHRVCSFTDSEKQVIVDEALRLTGKVGINEEYDKTVKVYDDLVIIEEFGILVDEYIETKIKLTINSETKRKFVILSFTDSNGVTKTTLGHFVK